jgi:hypothetical protein
MKSLLFISACGLALAALSACAPVTPPTSRVALDCPSDQGDLKLSSIAPDKKTCLYTTRDGDQVSLRLIPVSGSYEAALQPIEQELQGEIETAQPAANGDVSGKTDGKAADAGGKSATATATVSSKSAAARAADDAAQDARAVVHSGKKDSDDDDDSAKVDVGDGHDDRGDHAHIDLPGIHINADDDKADVNVGGINVNAGENGATVRVSRDVRLRGEAFSPQRRGFRSTFILARDDLKDGWKSVGYEAGGPKTGPITVAVFKAHEGHHHDVSEDVKRLVRHNGGV